MLIQNHISPGVWKSIPDELFRIFSITWPFVWELQKFNWKVVQLYYLNRHNFNDSLMGGKRSPKHLPEHLDPHHLL